MVRLPLRPTLDAWSIAGLPQTSAMVFVGPPLFCKPLESSFGSSGAAVVPVRSLGAVNPVLPSRLPIRLKPAVSNKPLTSGEPPLLRAMMLLLTVKASWLPSLIRPPVKAPLLPLTVDPPAPMEDM